MEATIEQIQREINGNTQNVYPVTLVGAVYDNSGNTLQDIISDLAKQSTLLEVKETVDELLVEITSPVHGLAALKSAIDEIDRTDRIEDQKIKDLF